MIPRLSQMENDKNQITDQQFTASVAYLLRERRFLEESVERISKMKTIHPISMDNIEVRLDRDKKEINFDICVTQKPKR